MKKVLLYLSLAALVLVSFSCKRGGAYTPISTGRPYEIIVIVNTGIWERPAGRALFDVLDSDVPGLPQSERSFRMMQATPQQFDITLKIIRNIIIVDIQDIYTQPKFKQANDVYSAPQSILTIQAPNEEEFAEFVTENKQVIIDFFTRAEMNRQIKLLEKNHDNNIATKVVGMFDCEVWVPGELTKVKEGENFLWASSGGVSVDQNFVIYSYPYTDKDTFTKEYFIHKRDSVMKENIPGAGKDMYMTTDTMTVRVKPITVQNSYALEGRGLWYIKGDFMGGPFVSHSRVDEINQRVITVEVFVYAPEKLKKDYIRFLEASLYTLRLPQDKSSNTKAVPVEANASNEQN